MLLDQHQARSLAEEDLIGGHLLNAWAAVVIPDGQEGRTATAGLLGHATELGHAGRLPYRGRRFGHGLVQEHGQEPVTNREADALGLGRAGKGSAAVLVETAGVG
jgi:hypothetical protein